MSKSIDLLLSIKENLDENGVLQRPELVHKNRSLFEGSLYYIFYKPINIPEMYEFFKQVGWVLPEDIIQLFSHFNGLHLCDILDILSLNEIIEYTTPHLPPNWIPIAYFDGGYQILIDLTKKGKLGYLMYQEFTTPFEDEEGNIRPSYRFDIDFQTWVYKFLTSENERFWEE